MHNLKLDSDQAPSTTEFNASSTISGVCGSFHLFHCIFQLFRGALVRLGWQKTPWKRSRSTSDIDSFAIVWGYRLFLMIFLIGIKDLVRTQTVLARASLLERHFFWFLVGHSLAIWNIRVLIWSPLFNGSQITKGSMAFGTRNAWRGGWLRRRCESAENFISHNDVDNYSFRQWGQNTSVFPDWFQRKTLVTAVMSSFANFHCLLSFPSNGNNRKRSLLLWVGMIDWFIPGKLWDRFQSLITHADHARTQATPRVRTHIHRIHRASIGSVQSISNDRTDNG